MKKLLLLLSTILCISCTSKTDFGSCVGLFDDKDPAKIYKLSAYNLVLGIIFMPFIAPPVFVIVDETFCPIGNKEVLK